MGADIDGWAGSNGWIRQQFNEYHAALLATADHAKVMAALDPEAMQGAVAAVLADFVDFGISWANAWYTTAACRAWRARVAAMATRPCHVTPAGHPARGALRVWPRAWCLI